MTPLVDADGPLAVAVLVSESDGRLRALLEHERAADSRFDLVGAFASHPDGDAVDALRSGDVPVEVVDVEAFYEAREAPLSDLDVREAYDERIAAAVERFDPDLVVCSGYRFILTDAVLDRFAPRIVSAHHADLTIREGGEPKYPGLRATRDAILDGQPATYETTHVVTPNVDRGPPLVRSRPFPVHEQLVTQAREGGEGDVLDAYVYAHREWMIREGGGPTLATTVDLIADGRVHLADGRAYVDGEPGPYRLGEQPPSRPTPTGGI